MRLAACRSCERSIIWVLTQSGKKMPIDPDPIVTKHGFRMPDGSEEDGGTPVVTFTSKPNQNERLYVSHFATCIHADQHRT